MDFKVFKILLAIQIILLFAQFWLGMSINLFVSVPKLTPFSFSGYSGGSEVLVHIVTGIAILLIAALILSYSIRLKSKLLSAISTAALVFAFTAPAAGYTFVLKGQNDGYSMAMAMSFLIAFTLYLACFFLIDRLQSTAQETP